MANIKLIFYGEDKETELECYCTTDNNIFLHIEHPSFSSMGVSLDKSTAIKFAKTLRTEINKMKGEGSDD